MEDGHFVSTEKDCNLRYPSEYSLQMHKKRHEMMLSLNKSNLPSSDQTPTPVRFIRQCEEIGLFQDLQNVNPFEETFRKAAEAVKKGTAPKQTSVSILNNGTSEDLHTPHIFPEEINIETNIQGTKTNSEKIAKEEVVVRTEADTSLKASNAPQQYLSPPVSNDRVSTTVSATGPVVRDRTCILDSITNEDSSRVTTAMPTFPATNLSTEHALTMTADPVQVLLRMPNGSLVQLATKPVPNTIMPVNVPPASLQLDETVKVLPRTCTNGGTVILATQNLQSTAEPTVSPPLSTRDVKQKLKQLLGSTSKITKQQNSVQKSVPVVNKNDSPNSKKNIKNDEDIIMDETEKEKREKILERNRKAAIRCRERRKRWVEELRKRADTMAVTNKALNDEIRCLKAEVANLRTLLLAHANCPVTLAAQLSSNESICVNNDRPCEVVNKRPRRECLTLDIEQATRAASSVSAAIELDTPTPTIVRSDKVLSSVAPPATPEQDRLVTFTDILAQERSSEISEEMVEERHLTSSASISGGTPTVIQINPNAVRPTHGFS